MVPTLREGLLELMKEVEKDALDVSGAEYGDKRVPHTAIRAAPASRAVGGGGCGLCF